MVAAVPRSITDPALRRILSDLREAALRPVVVAAGQAQAAPAVQPPPAPAVVLPAAATQAEAEAGTEAALRLFSPLRVAQAIAALAMTGGGGGVAATETIVAQTDLITGTALPANPQWRVASDAPAWVMRGGGGANEGQNVDLSLPDLPTDLLHFKLVHTVGAVGDEVARGVYLLPPDPAFGTDRDAARLGYMEIGPDAAATDGQRFETLEVWAGRWNELAFVQLRNATGALPANSRFRFVAVRATAGAAGTMLRNAAQTYALIRPLLQYADLNGAPTIPSLPAVVTEAEARAGTETGTRLWSPERVEDAIDALADAGITLTQARDLVRDYGRVATSDADARTALATLMAAAAADAQRFSYDDLKDKPAIPVLRSAQQTYDLITSLLDYDDLSNKPTIPVLRNAAQTYALIESLLDYDDLSNKPTIPAAQVPSDWNATTGVARILNKPSVPGLPAAVTKSEAEAGTETALRSWSPLRVAEAIAALATGGGNGGVTLSQVNTRVAALVRDFAEVATTDVNARTGIATLMAAAAADAERLSYDDLKDKPTIPSLRNAAQTYALIESLLDYDDLSNKPAIPAAQVPADWDATTGAARILNKPTIPAAQAASDWNATSGVTRILNKPSLVSQAEAEAGTATDERLWSAERVKQAIEADVHTHRNTQLTIALPTGTFTPAGANTADRPITEAEMDANGSIRLGNGDASMSATSPYVLTIPQTRLNQALFVQNRSAGHVRIMTDWRLGNNGRTFGGGGLVANLAPGTSRKVEAVSRGQVVRYETGDLPDVRTFAREGTTDVAARTGIATLMNASAADAERISYDDLKDKPTIPAAVGAATEEATGTVELATAAEMAAGNAARVPTAARVKGYVDPFGVQAYSIQRGATSASAVPAAAFHARKMFLFATAGTAQTAAWTVTFPAGASRLLWVQNGRSGAITLAGTGGAITYALPGGAMHLVEVVEGNVFDRTNLFLPIDDAAFFPGTNPATLPLGSANVDGMLRVADTNIIPALAPSVTSYRINIPDKGRTNVFWIRNDSATRSLVVGAVGAADEAARRTTVPPLGMALVAAYDLLGVFDQTSRISVDRSLAYQLNGVAQSQRIHTINVRTR